MAGFYSFGFLILSVFMRLMLEFCSHHVPVILKFFTGQPIHRSYYMFCVLWVKNIGSQEVYLVDNGAELFRTK